jgi:hypothetical protein
MKDNKKKGKCFLPLFVFFCRRSLLPPAVRQHLPKEVYLKEKQQVEVGVFE